MSNIQYDLERMGSLFSDIKKNFDDLEAMDVHSVEDLHDRFFAFLDIQKR